MCMILGAPCFFCKNSSKKDHRFDFTCQPTSGFEVADIIVSNRGEDDDLYSFKARADVYAGQELAKNAVADAQV